MADTKKQNLYQRILAISGDAGALGKGGKAAPGMGGYEFHRIDDVEEHLRPLLVKHGVVAMPSLVSHHTESTPTGKGSQVQHIVEAVVDLHLINADEPEDRMSIQSLGQGIDYSDKGPGKAMSYALKTAYLCAFHLKGNPDAESDDHERAAPAKPKPKQAKPNGKTGRTDAEMKALAKLAESNQIDPKDLKGVCQERFGKPPRELTEAELELTQDYCAMGGVWPDAQEATAS